MNPPCDSLRQAAVAAAETGDAGRLQHRDTFLIIVCGREEPRQNVTIRIGTLAQFAALASKLLQRVNTAALAGWQREQRGAGLWCARGGHGSGTRCCVISNMRLHRITGWCRKQRICRATPITKHQYTFQYGVVLGNATAERSCLSILALCGYNIQRAGKGFARLQYVYGVLLFRITPQF